MANEHTGPDEDRPNPSDGAQPDQTEQLIWGLFDGNIDEAGLTCLETMLTTSDAARKKYVQIATLHSELTAHFGRADDSITEPPRPPILGSLGNVLPTDAAGLDQLTPGGRIARKLQLVPIANRQGFEIRTVRSDGDRLIVVA